MGATPGAQGGLWRRIVSVLASPMGELGRGRDHTRRIRELEARTRRDPRDDRAFLNLADTYRARGRFEDAVAAYWCAARVHLDRHNHAKALAVLKRLLELAPSDVFAERSAARCLETLGRRREAAAAYHRAAKLAEAQGKRDDAEAFDRHARALLPAASGPRPSPIRVEPWRPAPDAEEPRPVAHAIDAQDAIHPPPEEPDVWSCEMLEPPAARTPARPSRAAQIDAIVREEVAAHLEAGDSTVEVEEPSKELALDVEAQLLGNDPAEASTTQCSANELNEIRTRTLVRKEERELEAILQPEEDQATHSLGAAEPW